MSGRYHARFFDSQSTESQIKLRIYQSYLVPWASKVGSRGGTVWVVDGFAGRGRYKSGEPGSPELAMRLAQELTDAGKAGYRLQCIFGERKATNASALYQLLGRYPAASPLTIEGDFWARIADVTSFVGSSPALLFVDPFGLLGIDFAALTALVSKLPRVDLIVNFRSPSAHRLAPTLSSRVSASVGSDDWTPETISEVFRANLQRVGKFLTPATLTVRERFGGSIRSELILAARHADAYELWNDRAVIEAENLLAADGEPAPAHGRDSTIDEVQARLLDWASVKKRWRRPEAVSWYVVAYCGDVHTGTIKRAHEALTAKGRFRRLGRSNKIDLDWFDCP